MKFYISGLADVRKHINSDGITKVVGLINPTAADDTVDILKNTYGHLDHLLLRFNDIEIESDKLKSPSKEHVEKIIDFAKGFTDDDVVLFHCHAGISRSTAAAIISLSVHSDDYEEIVKRVKATRPQAHPNQILIRHASEIIDEGIWDAVNNVIWSKIFMLNKGLKQMERDVEGIATKEAEENLEELRKLLEKFK